MIIVYILICCCVSLVSFLENSFCFFKIWFSKKLGNNIPHYESDWCVCVCLHVCACVKFLVCFFISCKLEVRCKGLIRFKLNIFSKNTSRMMCELHAVSHQEAHVSCPTFNDSEFDCMVRGLHGIFVLTPFILHCGSGVKRLHTDASVCRESQAISLLRPLLAFLPYPFLAMIYFLFLIILPLSNSPFFSTVQAVPKVLLYEVLWIEIPWLKFTLGF